MGLNLKFFQSKVRHGLVRLAQKIAIINAGRHGLKGYCVMITLVVWSGCRPGNNKEKLQQEARPNIVIIMADDLGFSDLGAYGGEINTPVLDELAFNGIRFTRFYNTSRCCPTRASLLTGLYPHQAGIGRMTMDAGKPGYRGFLTGNTVTIAEVLGQAGYHTGMTGKWHVSETERLEEENQLKWLAHQADFGPFSDTATYPTARGFDKYYGNIWGVVDYFDPFSLVNNTQPVETVPKNYYHTTAISDSAAAYIRAFAGNENPFFLYVAHCAPHWPLHAPAEDIEKYENTYKAGWDEIRKKRYQRLLELDLFQAETAPLPEKMFPEKRWEDNADSVWDARAMAVHAAMVENMDRSIGSIISALKETGQFDNTLIMFLSDNGASSERPSKYGPGFDRSGSTRDGRPVVFPVDKSTGALPGPQTVHAGIGPEWANVINTPFRYWKAKVFEGGIATPFIVHWPGHVKPGSIVHEPGHVIDLMTTCVAAAQASYPGNFENRNISPTEGSSLLPVFRGGGKADSTLYFWEHFGAGALRKGPWKLVRLDKNSDWELYNLEKNRTETEELSNQYPGKLEELAQLWEETAQRTQVYPTP